MPSGNQGQGKPKDQNRNDAGPREGGAREAIQNAGQRLQEGAEQVGHRLRENLGDLSEEAGRRYRQAEGTMARNPAPSVLIGFGVGFGIGLVLTTMLSEHHEETWADRHLPGPLRHRLNDSLRHAPEHLHDLADAIRNLPDQIARRLPSSLKG